LTRYADRVVEALRVSFGPSLLAPIQAHRRPAIEAELFSRVRSAVEDEGARLFEWHVAIMTIAAES
jgi:hypothetical protein